ncbi:hypothetical protein IJG14_03100, partial [bacterium]|nr:hypothetical protein [bacterium]
MGITFGQFLNRVNSAKDLVKLGNASGGLSITGRADINNIFSSASLEDLKNIDFNTLLSSDDVDKTASEDMQALQEIVKAFMEIDSVSAAIDVDGNGELTQEEAISYLESIMGGDGDSSNFTLEDMDKVFSSLGVDLEAEAHKAVLDALGLASEIDSDDANTDLSTNQDPSVDGTDPTKNTSAADNVNNTNAAGNNGNTNNGTTGSYNASPSGTFNPTSANGNAKTADEIKTEIANKNNDITKIEADAEEQIKAKEEAKEKALKEQAGVSDEEYNAYKEQEQNYNNQIADKEKAISEKDDFIRDTQATMTSNENYIGALEAQKAYNSQMLGKLSKDSDDYASKSSSINTQISNIDAKIKALKEENAKLADDLAKAENEKTQLEEEKQTLEQQKQNLISETLNSSAGAQAKGGYIDSIRGSLEQYDKDIASINATKNEKIAGIKDEIQVLETQLKDVEAQEERVAFLKENKAQVGLGLTGEELVEVAN